MATITQVPNESGHLAVVSFVGLDDMQVPDPSNKYGPAFLFGNSTHGGTYKYNPLQYIPGSGVKCNDNGSFPL